MRIGLLCWAAHMTQCSGQLGVTFFLPLPIEWVISQLFLAWGL